MKRSNIIRPKEWNEHENKKNRLYPNYSKRVARALRMHRRLEDKKEEADKKKQEEKVEKQITIEENFEDQKKIVTDENKQNETEENTEKNTEKVKNETPRQRIKRIREYSNEAYEILIKWNIKYRFNRYWNSNECAQKMIKEDRKDLLIEKIRKFKELNQETLKIIMDAFLLDIGFKKGEQFSVTKKLLKNINSFKNLDYKIIPKIIENCKYQYWTLELLFQKRKHFEWLENLTDEEIQSWFKSVSNYTRNKYKTREEFKKALVK